MTKKRTDEPFEPGLGALDGEPEFKPGLGALDGVVEPVFINYPTVSISLKYVALDWLEGRAKPGDIIDLDIETAAIYLALGRVEIMRPPEPPSLVSILEE